MASRLIIWDCVTDTLKVTRSPNTLLLRDKLVVIKDYESAFDAV